MEVAAYLSNNTEYRGGRSLCERQNLSNRELVAPCSGGNFSTTLVRPAV